MRSRIDTPQKTANAGAGAGFLTVFAIVWNALVWFMLVPNSQAPFLLKSLFVLAGILVAVLALMACIQRVRGGSAQLDLTREPVEHGVPFQANFTVPARVDATQWRVQARIESTTRHQSGFGCLWEQWFTAQYAAAGRITAQVLFPADLPCTASSDDETTYRAVLVLSSGHLQWDFPLSTMAATAVRPVRTAGGLPAEPASSAAKPASRSLRWVLLLVIPVQLLIACALFSPLLGWRPFDEVRAATGLGALSTRVQTREFDVRVTNLLVNDWARLGRLVGVASVTDGTLSVRVNTLDVQPVGNCDPRQGSCVLKSVRLLLSGDKETSFETLATSEPLEIGVDLYEQGRWSLPASQPGHVFSMVLPRAIDIRDTRLKLVIEMADGATTYPAHGTTLALHRALAQATSQADPCESVRMLAERAQAGCMPGSASGNLHDKISAVLPAELGLAWFKAMRWLGWQAPGQPDTLDHALLAALESENWAAAAALLDAGASPNARVEGDPYSPLGYAAAANHLQLVKRLLQQGADPLARRTNRQGQIVTPLTQALRTDASQAVTALLLAGAKAHTDDPTGWTAMHIAAYSSASQSLAVLAGSGANFNERTPADREQTVLMTAIQSGSINTVQALLKHGADPSLTDKEGKNACDWARFYTRSPSVRAMVCTPETDKP